LDSFKDDEEIIRENLERAAKFSCYVLANKIIFYKALRRRFTRMRALRISPEITKGSELKELLENLFDHGISISGDYETVFRGDFGDTLPFLNDEAVDSWRYLSTQTDAFDFTQINYEVMGQIFERLLSTTERHKFGQHYTRSEVVDLINAFCIREPEATVFDPACGGGTFLVRAYQRKKDLSDGELDHQEIINQLYGLDLSIYPVHLTTINLATRDLVKKANYPLVARKDFFEAAPGSAIFHVPLGAGEQATWLEIPKVDVVVGNPPYVRQEKINEYYGKKYKDFLRRLQKDDAPSVELSGRSDILCYFFTHGFAFLNEGGYMGLLTSSSWLDTAYGFQLQKFLLDNFEIKSIFESNCEPWFTGARVTTAATILRRQPDRAKREANNIKFVWIKKPLLDFLGYAANGEQKLTNDELSTYIENQEKEEENDRWRLRVVNQGELYNEGCLPFAVSEDEDADDDSTEDDSETIPTQLSHEALTNQSQEVDDNYIGYKWGIYLRAPEIFFKLLRRCKEQFVPLGQIAEIRRGITSGCDDFFFPYDVTDEALNDVKTDREFIERYGIRRAETKKIRIVLAGDESQHLIEAKYLEPEVHSVMGLDSVQIRPERLKRKVLLVSEPKSTLKGTEVLKYIKWGEQEGYPERSTIQGRVRTGRNWYDIITDRRSDLLWCKAHQYRHIAWLNAHKLVANCRMYDIFLQSNVNDEVLCAALNSTVVALTKAFFGRYVGREGNLDTEVLDVKMMLVPDPRQVTAKVRKRLDSALKSLSNRQATPIVDVDSDATGWTGELALEDRQELDDAVLEMLGISNPKERQTLRDELYAEITQLYRQLRVAERIMQRHRATTARAGRITAHSIADEIWDSEDTKPEYKTILEFIPPKTRCETIDLPSGHARILKQTLFQPDAVQIGDTIIELGDPARSVYVKAASDSGLHGEIRVPIDPKVCHDTFIAHRDYVLNVTEGLTKLASEHTADETLQERVVRELLRKMRR
jgi:type I restriction-modification system DNA methylase subunit